MSHYVLCYQGPSDPTEQEEGALVSALQNVTLVDRMPGTLLVEGNKSDLMHVVQHFQEWNLSPAVGVTVNPPGKRVVNGI
jgi:hypothetical protein